MSGIAGLGYAIFLTIGTKNLKGLSHLDVRQSGYYSQVGQT